MKLPKSEHIIDIKVSSLSVAVRSLGWLWLVIILLSNRFQVALYQNTEQYKRLAEPKFQVGRNQWEGQTCFANFSQKEKVRGSITEVKIVESISSAPREQVTTAGMGKPREKVPPGCRPRALLSSSPSTSSFSLTPHSRLEYLLQGRVHAHCLLWQTAFPKLKINAHCSYSGSEYLKLILTWKTWE